MVKLFVGGLPEGVDSIRLRQLFSQFVIVNECDVIKDYAFVHVAEESDARIAIEKLDGYILEGKSINIRRSTSKLRKEPGMDKRCYRCGAADHKTPQCPNESSTSGVKRAISTSNLSSIPDQKRFAGDGLGTEPTVAYAGRPAEVNTVASLGYGYAVEQSAIVAQHQAVPKVDPDPELPRPFDNDLVPLYEQYIESRTKYFYFRERLTKEVKARAHAIPAVTVTPLQAPYVSSSVYSAPMSSALQYNPQQNPDQTAVTAHASTHFYANAVSGSNYSTQMPVQSARLY